MREKKLIAITVIALFAVMLAIPLASNAAAPNPWTPSTILPQKVNTQPKAIPTNSLGDYLRNGDILVYDSIAMQMECFPEIEWMTFSGQMNVSIEYNYTAWGDWFIVSLGPLSYIAIDNQTREIGLNGTQPFTSPPENASVINRQTGTYFLLAIPTGIKAGDNLKMLMPMGNVLITITTSVTGRITTTILEPGLPTYYDTWMVHGNFANASGSIAIEIRADTQSGLAIGGTIGISMPGDIDGTVLMGMYSLLQYNSTASSVFVGPIPLQFTGIDSYGTPESSGLLAWHNFKYEESGYWYRDWSAMSNGAVGVVRLDSLDGSYANVTLGTNSGSDIPVWIGLSQTTKIPDNLWNWWVTTIGGTWNSTFYNTTTHTGHIEAILYNATEELFNITDFTRMIPDFGPVNSILMAPPWIREGSLFTLFTILPMFFPINDTLTDMVASFGPEGGEPVYLLVLCRVSGAATVGIGGNNYDCWKTEMLLPTDLSALNVTQLRYEAYFERTSGILVEAKADLEMNMGGIPYGYHKTWTLANEEILSDTLPTPEGMNAYHNNYTHAFSMNSLETLDPSMFNGGSVTANCSDAVQINMWTTTQLAGNTSIAGKPIVKFMQVETNTTVTYYTATVNFYYTPSELAAMGADESGFTICAWNGTAWEPLNTTVDFDGRVVSANTTNFSLFALVAAALPPGNILGPIVSALLLSGFGQPPMGGSMLWILGGIAALLLAVIAVAIVILARRH